MESITGVLSPPTFITFELPNLPGSVNTLYEFNRRDSGLPVRRLRGEWALWKSTMKVYVPRCDWAIGKFLRIELDFQSDSWYHANGKLKRKDLDNLEKLTIDTIFEKLGADDCYIVEKVSKKSIGPSNRVMVRLEVFGKIGFDNDQLV